MVATATLECAAVPRLWDGETFVCLATGPSLTQADVSFCRGRARVIAIKHAITFAPWADVLYACGSDSGKWWQRHGDALQFDGPKYTLDPSAAKWATVLKNTGHGGLETDPTGLRNGRNSGYQAINLAVHLGARKIVLLGYDMHDVNGQDHFFGNHAHGTRLPFMEFRKWFPGIVDPLKTLGVSVINATRGSALECFPQRSLAEAFT